MSRAYQKIYVIVLSCALSTCSASEAVFLVIQGAGALSAACELEAQPDTFVTSGVYDPSFDSSFLFTPVVQNLLTPTNVDNQTLGDNNALFPEANRISLAGYDVCYLRGDDPRVADFGSFSSGIPIDCEADGLPGEFIPSAGTIEPLGSLSQTLPILTDPALKTLFGDDFQPSAIPQLFTDPVFVTDLNPAGAFGPFESPASATRSIFWGDFPETGSATVYVLARAVGTRANGAALSSEYIAYAVNVVPGLLLQQCVLTPGTCPDGMTMGVIGSAIDFDASCVPASGFGTTCVEFTTCPDN